MANLIVQKFTMINRINSPIAPARAEFDVGLAEFETPPERSILFLP